MIELDTEGTYQVIATIPGYGDKDLIAIDENWDNHGILEMVLEPINTAQGVVKNEDGSIASNVKIELKDEDGTVLFVGGTDEDVYYQFPLFEDDKNYIASATDGLKNRS